MKQEFNINNYVEFVLTERGANIVNNYYAPYRKNRSDRRSRTIYREGDTYCDQLWCVMHIFGGDNTKLGLETFCKDATISFEVKEKTSD